MTNRITDHLSESDRAFLRELETIVPGSNRLFFSKPIPARKAINPENDALWNLMRELIFFPDPVTGRRWEP